MGAKPLAETYEELKVLRRRGELDLAMQGVVERLPLSDKKLDAPDVEKLIRHLDIQTLADRVFGDESKAAAWLNRPSISLSGQKPIDLLKDELGAAVVRETLEQIDSGIFA